MKKGYVVESRSDATPATVFAILADAPGWQNWAGPAVPRSSWETGSPAGGLGAVRRLGRGRLSSREEIVAYDPPHHLAYVLRSGERLHHYRASVDLIAQPGGGTHIVWSGDVDTASRGVGTALVPLFRLLVAGFARRLARYAENVSLRQ